MSTQPELPPLSEPPVSPLPPGGERPPAPTSELGSPLLRHPLHPGLEPPSPAEGPPSPVLEPVPAPPPPEPALDDPEPAFTAPDERPPEAPEPELPPAAAVPPEQAPGGGVRVLVRLREGAVLVVGSYDDAESARRRARELVDEIQSEDAWVFVDGRPVTPVEVDRIYLDR